MDTIKTYRVDVHAIIVDWLSSRLAELPKQGRIPAILLRLLTHFERLLRRRLRLHMRRLPAVVEVFIPWVKSRRSCKRCACCVGRYQSTAREGQLARADGGRSGGRPVGLGRVERGSGSDNGRRCHLVAHGGRKFLVGKVQKCTDSNLKADIWSIRQCALMMWWSKVIIWATGK